MGAVRIDHGVRNGQGCSVGGKDSCVLTVEIGLVALGFSGLGHPDAGIGSLLSVCLYGVSAVCVTGIFFADSDVFRPQAAVRTGGFFFSALFGFFCLSIFCSFLYFRSCFLRLICTSTFRGGTSCQNGGCDHRAQHKDCHDFCKSLLISHIFPFRLVDQGFRFYHQRKPLK